MLKPGGAIQLVELDPFHPVPETPIVSYYRGIEEAGFDVGGLLHDTTTKLHNMLLAVGFVDINTETKPTPVGKMWGEIGAQGTAAYGGAMRKIAKLCMRAGSIRSDEEYDELMDKLEQEWDEQGTQYHGAIICARKPPARHL